MDHKICKSLSENLQFSLPLQAYEIIIFVYKQVICQAKDRLWPDKKTVWSDKKKLRQIWDISGFLIDCFCFTPHATIRTCWTAAKRNVGWDFPLDISDLIVGRTGPVGNPLFANQRMLSRGLWSWDTNLYYNLITGVLYFPAYKVSCVCIKPP